MKTEEFISSLSFDKRLAEYDMKGGVAHCRMLSKCRIISRQDAEKIIGGLKKMISDLNNDRLTLAGEDIHMAVESELIRRIGPVGGRMHTARSRNDQVVLDVKLYMKEIIKQNIKKCVVLVGRIKQLAKDHIDAVMPGYTHLQEAQPVLFSHYMLAFAWMFVRDIGRLRDCLDRMDENPLGSCALAGTSFPIDRDMTTKLLGFKRTGGNSIDAVSDRDFIIEYVSALSIHMIHLSRMAEDFIIWASTPFGFIALSGEYSSGSSIMPQKRNPDYLELLRAQSGLMTGKLVSIITIMKGLPLSYNRDMQEDKRVLFDAVDIYEKSSDMISGFLENLKINAEKMKNACRNGFLEATELADYLASKGVPFRLGHAVVKRIVEYASGKNKRLKDLQVSEFKSFSDKFENDVFEKLRISTIVARKNSKGGTGKNSVQSQIKEIDKFLKKFS